MRERSQVAARADGAARGDVRDDTGDEEREQQLDGLEPRAGVPLRERVRAEQHRGPHDLVRIRLPHAAGMAPQQAELQLAGQLLGDRLRHEAAEARVDAVGVLAVQRLE